MQTLETYTDKTLTCISCREPFTFTAGEQQFFAARNFSNAPRRCKKCRAERGKTNVKVETQTICDECGIPTTVPFKPTQGRPVRCRACFQGNRA